MILTRSSRPEVFCKKGVLREISQNSQENTSPRVSLLIKQLYIKKETLAQVFSREFCEISESTFFTEHLWWLLLFKYFDEAF